MSKKIEIDYTHLENTLNKKQYKLAEVQDRLVKVAFDIVRFRDADKAADLWQIQAGDDGEYIVALYQTDAVEKTATDWEVKLNKVSNHLQFSYKGDPLVSLASSDLGLNSSHLKNIESYLPEKLAKNKKLVQTLLDQTDKTTKKQILNKYPELF